MVTVIIVASLAVVACVCVHLACLQGLSRVMARLGFLSSLRVGVVILVAILGHLIEIGLFALGLRILSSPDRHGFVEGNLHGALDLFYYSAVTYTSLGYGDIVPTGALRSYAAIEALTGLVLITWTASFTFLVMERYWGQRREPTGS